MSPWELVGETGVKMCVLPGPLFDSKIICFCASWGRVGERLLLGAAVEAAGSWFRTYNILGPTPAAALGCIGRGVVGRQGWTPETVEPSPLTRLPPIWTGFPSTILKNWRPCGRIAWFWGELACILNWGGDPGAEAGTLEIWRFPVVGRNWNAWTVATWGWGDLGKRFCTIGAVGRSTLLGRFAGVPVANSVSNFGGCVFSSSFVCPMSISAFALASSIFFSAFVNRLAFGAAGTEIFLVFCFVSPFARSSFLPRLLRVLAAGCSAAIATGCCASKTSSLPTTGTGAVFEGATGVRVSSSTSIFIESSSTMFFFSASAFTVFARVSSSIFTSSFWASFHFRVSFLSCFFGLRFFPNSSRHMGQ